MIYVMAARVSLMVCDFQCSVDDALAWVTRRLPKTLRRYYWSRITEALLWV
jgi:hypothetical protein